MHRFLGLDENVICLCCVVAVERGCERLRKLFGEKDIKKMMIDLR